MIQWFKEHLELLAGLFFGVGGVYVQHQQHGKEIDNIKFKQNNYSDDIVEIKGDIKTLLERTKHL